MTKRLTFKRQFAEVFDLPSEIILDMPIIRIVAKNEATIENHKGIVEYSSKVLRINSMLGIIKINGYDLQIKEIDQSDIIISGEINSLEFLNEAIK